MARFTTAPATLGTGKAIHALITEGGAKGALLCMINNSCTNYALPTACADTTTAVTCKRCLKNM